MIVLRVFLLVLVVAFARAQVSYKCWDKPGSGPEQHTQTSGTITDHGGPGNYLPGSRCAWLIEDPGLEQTITVLFDKFNLTRPNGITDFLDIRDGRSANAPEIVWFTGSDMPEPVTSTGPAMYISFVSHDGTDRGSDGFSLRYSASSCPNKCTGNGYCFDAKCTCEPGFEGADCTKRSCANNCGGSDIGNCDNQSNVCVCKEGWYGGNCLRPYCEEGHTMRARAGNFTDHHKELSLKDNYLHNANCTWLIDPDPPANTITLNFSDFEVEKDFDYVVVYDGANMHSPVLGNFSGPVVPGPVTAKSGKMFITFTTDVGLSFGGFTCKYTSDGEGEKIVGGGSGGHAGMSTGGVLVLCLLFIAIGIVVGAAGLVAIQRWQSTSSTSYKRVPIDEGY